MSKKPTLIELLTERYFGKAFEEQQKVSNAVIKCMALDEFAKLKIDMTSPPVKAIFDAANFQDPEAKRLTADRLNQIYDKIKPIRAQSGFF